MRRDHLALALNNPALKPLKTIVLSGAFTFGYKSVDPVFYPNDFWPTVRQRGFHGLIILVCFCCETFAELREQGSGKRQEKLDGREYT